MCLAPPGLWTFILWISFCPYKNIRPPFPPIPLFAWLIAPLSSNVCLEVPSEQLRLCEVPCSVLPTPSTPHSSPIMAPCRSLPHCSVKIWFLFGSLLCSQVLARCPALSRGSVNTCATKFMERKGRREGRKEKDSPGEVTLTLHSSS